MTNTGSGKKYSSPVGLRHSQLMVSSQYTGLISWLKKVPPINR